MVYDIIVIGDTPSAYTASIYAKTANLNLLHLFPKNCKPFKLVNVELFAGFVPSSENIADKNKILEEFIGNCKKQCENFKVNLKSFDNVEICEKNLQNNTFTIKVDNSEKLEANHIIIEEKRHEEIIKHSYDLNKNNEQIRFIKSEGDLVQVCGEGCKVFLDLKDNF